MEVKFYKCNHCGNVAIKVVDSGVPIICCGEPMVELVAGSIDAALEKHVPDVTIDGNQIHVVIGSVEHPMTEEHSIQVIVLATEKGYQVCPLPHDGQPKASFVVADGDKPVKVYEYCNLHGLWEKAL